MFNKIEMQLNTYMYLEMLVLFMYGFVTFSGLFLVLIQFNVLNDHGKMSIDLY